MKHIKLISLLAVTSILFVIGTISSPRAHAAAFSTKAECASNVMTISATAPSSVTTNAVFSMTNVSSTSTAPGSITINKIVSRTSVTNASPSVISGTWTGTGAGSFTAHFPDTSLTATGAAGTQIKVALNSIDLYINGGTVPVTCSLANGQLTANKPGESLTLLTVGITAPAATPTPQTPVSTTPTPTSNPSKPTTPTPSTTTSPSSPTPSSTNTPTTQTGTSAPVSSSTDTPSQQVTITVVDSSGKPIENASIVVDNNKPVTTDSKGIATLTGLSAGDHKVAVLGKHTQITRTINVSSGADPVSLTIQLPRRSMAPIFIIAIGIAAISACLAGVCWLLVYRHHKAKLAGHILPGAGSAPVNQAVTAHPTIVSTQATAALSAHSTPSATIPLPPQVQPAPPVAPTQPAPTPAIPQQTRISTPIAPQPVPQPQPSSVPASQPLPVTPPQVHIATAAPPQPGQMITPQTPTQN